MRQRKISIIILLLVVVIIALFLAYLSSQRSGYENKQSAITNEGIVRIIPELSSNEHVFWEGSEEIVVIEYFSIDCPGCRNLLLEKETLPDKVKSQVRLIYRWFPLLNLHPQSLERAIIAECVSSVSGDSSFFAFLKSVAQLYQEKTSENVWLIDIAKQYVHDEIQFEECVSNKHTIDIINHQRAGGYSMGVFSTPTFIVIKKGESIKKFDLVGSVSGKRLLESLSGQE